jgi:hypothetical protein
MVLSVWNEMKYYQHEENNIKVNQLNKAKVVKSMTFKCSQNNTIFIKFTESLFK